MATFYVTNAVAKGMLGDTTAPGAGLAAHFDAGTAMVIEVKSGSMPADADAADAGTILAVLTCSAVAFSGFSDATPGGRATFAAITSDPSADATGTATHFVGRTQAAGTRVCIGDVGTSGASFNLNTVAITAGSTVSATAGTITQPEGP